VVTSEIFVGYHEVMMVTIGFFFGNFCVVTGYHVDWLPVTIYGILQEYPLKWGLCLN
jgi:hypothetical protein